LSDAITLKYMNLLQKDKEPKVEGEVQYYALEYAKSILEGKEAMTILVDGKEEKERKKLLDEWKVIEEEVNKKKEEKFKIQKHWSDILKKDVRR